jgi:hypothetical protein
MAVYTIWNNTIPSGTSSVNASSRTDGVQFTVSQTCVLNAIGYYVPASSTTTGSSYTASLWSTTNANAGTLITGPTGGTGTWTTGAWNWVSLGAGVTLSTGTTYVAALSSPDNLQYYHGYWGTGNPGASGMTSGPINVPGVGTALGGIQQPYNSGANVFPNSVSSGGTWYGVDIQVTVASVGQSLMMAGLI